jgi:ketosteroid isomerase-like protein
MTDNHTVYEAEDTFFGALLGADRASLDGLLTDDFVLVDVMRGTTVPRDALLDLVGSGDLAFVKIERVDDVSVRTRPDLAVVVGRTRMTMRFQGSPEFTAPSRYTHVYVTDAGNWRLLSAQGTREDGEI